MFLNDPIHGFIRLSDLQADLVALPELSRLAWIKQLGLSFLSFPGATHTRLCHVIGVSHVAGRMASALGLSDKEKLLLEAAGLLHDVGHTPFSHALESLLPGDHMDITYDLVTGKKEFPLPGAGRIPKVLEYHRIDPDEVGELINNRHKDRPLQSIIFSDVDCDQLDYLQRDSYFSGVAHGAIDMGRILHTLHLDRESQQVVILEKGVDSIEEMIVARDHMYSAVYAHKTGRIAEMMLLRAMQVADEPIADFHVMYDGQLLAELMKGGDASRRLTQRIITRDLYKSAFAVVSAGVDERTERVKALLEQKPAAEIERDLAAAAGLEAGEVIVDLPVDVLKLSEPRLKSFNIQVKRKSGAIVPLLDVSTLARALTQKESTHTVFAVYAPRESQEALASACAELLGGP